MEFTDLLHINKVKGAIDKEGQPIAWMNRISGPDNTSHWTITGGADEIPYDIPNIHIDYVQSRSTIPIGPMRAVGNIQNAFVNESFIDELAHLSNKDPLDFRIKLMHNNKRQLRCIKNCSRSSQLEWK